MDKTQFAGLTRLDPGESLGVDGYSFQHINPQIIDRLLQIGAVDHRHDGHAALADPTDDPVVTEVAGGGQILADTTVWACYTLLDADGGETRPSPAQNITTPAPIPAPDDSPSVALDLTGGALLANTYMYALTLLDGNGGESTIGPAANIQRPPGPANARVQITGLSSIATAAGASGWRLWRSVGGARWGYLATGDAASDTFTDDGAVSLDCTQVPPARNTTNAVNQVRVVVPNTQPAGTVSYRIYMAEDGSFTSPSLAGTFAIATAGANHDFPTLDLADGQPPAVSLAIPGAAQINADTDVYGWTWKASVADLAALPALGNADGDIRVTRDTRIAYIWDDADSEWVVLFTGYLKLPVADAAALPATGNTHGDMRITLDDNALHVWGTDDAWHDIGGGGGGGGGGVTPLVWTAFTALGGGWADASGVSAEYPAAWAKDDYGIVRFRGSLNSGGSGFALLDVITTLPVDARPAADVRVIANLNDVSDQHWLVELDVLTDGRVRLDGVIANGQPYYDPSFDGSSNGLLFLDGITYPTIS